MISIDGRVEVRCEVGEAWELFNEFGRVAALIPTVEDVRVEGDQILARVETRLGALPVSSRVVLEVIERETLVSIEAHGVSYLGETLTEQVRKDIKGVSAGSVGKMNLRLVLESGLEPGLTTILYFAEVEAEGRLKRIYRTILKTKVPGMMEQFAENLRGELEGGSSTELADAAAEPASRTQTPSAADAARGPEPREEAARAPASIELRRGGGLLSRAIAWIRQLLRRLRGYA